MAKKGAKINPTFVPVPGEIRQGLLFGDARTPEQAAVLAAADGTRNLAGIARYCNLPREECERLLLAFLNEGELRAATNEELLAGAERLRAAGRLESAVQLLQSLVEGGGGLPSEERLGELLELSARRKEAAAVYNRLAMKHAQAGRLGDALASARRAAELQPGNWQLQNALSELSILTGRPDEAARVWRAYARRLANIGSFEQALQILDVAQKQLAGNDILMYAEAEVLSLLERARQEPLPGGAETLSEQAKAYLHGAEAEDPASGPELQRAGRAEQTTEPGHAPAFEPLAAEVSGEREESPLTADPAGVRRPAEVRDFVAAAVQARSGMSAAERKPVTPEAPAAEAAQSFSPAEVRAGLSGAFSSSYIPPRALLDGEDAEAAYDAGRGRSGRREGWRPGTVAYLVIGVVLLSAFASAWDFQSREAMRRAAETAAGLISASAQEPLYRKQAAAAQARRMLQAQQPFWDFLQAPEYRQQCERVEVFAAQVEQELLALRARQQGVLDRWAKEQNEENLSALRALAERDDLSDPAVIEARRLHREWLQKQNQRPDALQGLLHTLQDGKRPAAERYGAYQTLVLEHPYAFQRDYPQGCRNLSLPAEIHVYAGKNTEEIPFAVLADGRALPRPLELPLDDEVALTLRMNGFRAALPAGEGMNETVGIAEPLPVPRPFTRVQTYRVRKIARCAVTLPFVARRCVFSESGNRILAVGEGRFAVLNAETGAVIRQEEQPGGRTVEHPQGYPDDLCLAGGWAFFSDRSEVCGVPLDSGDLPAEGRPAVRWSSPPGIGFSGIAAGFLNGRGAEGEPAVAVSVLREGAATAFWNNRAVNLLTWPGGRALWESGADTVPAAGPGYLLNGQLWYVDVQGRLHVLDSDGMQVVTVELPGMTRISGRPVFFPVAAGMMRGAPGKAAADAGAGETVFDPATGRVLLLAPQTGGVRMLLVDLAAAEQALTLWQAAGDYEDWFRLSGGVVWLRRSGKGVEARALADGKLLGDYPLPDGMNCDPALLRGRVLLPGTVGVAGATTGQRGILSAVREDNGVPGGRLWEYELPAKPAALAVWERGREARIVCGSGRTLYLFDD